MKNYKCEAFARGKRKEVQMYSNFSSNIPCISSACLVGGVEPIAEVAGDGEELELPQEATKFIKKKQASKKVKKGRSTNSSITPHLCTLLLSTILSSFLLRFFVSLFGAEYSPALRLVSSASPCHISNWPVSKYITPAVHPQHCSQLATKSWPEPWHWYLFTVCHTIVIHLYFPSRHSALSHLLFVHTTLTAVGSWSAESAWFGF